MVERDLVAVTQGVGDHWWRAFDDEVVKSSVACAEIAESDPA